MHDAPVMLCAGEALTDMIQQGEEQWTSRAGGSVWNVARALAVLCERTAFAGAISRDRFGDALWRGLVEGQRSGRPGYAPAAARGALAAAGHR
jgi:hypothetical protein